MGLYLIGWKETETTFKATVGESEVASLTPRANEGATGNPPYTITVTNEDYYEIEVNASEAVDMKIEANGRVIFFGLKAIKE